MAKNSLWSPRHDCQCHPAIYWANKCYRNILPYKTLVISIMVGHFGCKHSYIVEKNVPIEFILPSRCQDGAECLGMETTSFLCYGVIK